MKTRPRSSLPAASSRTFVIVTAACALLHLSPTASGGEPAGISVWTLNGMERVQPGDPPGSAAGVRIRAARGEWEPFQVALRSKGGTIQGITAEVSSLAGGAGAIPRGSFRLHREHFVYLRRPSLRSEAAPGLYPDALLPFADPFTGKPIPPRQESDDPAGAKYAAVPFDLREGFDEVLWVEVLVPREAKAGEYRGTLALKARGRDLSPAVPIELTVWDFDLLETPALLSNFGGFSRTERAHGVKPGTPEALALERRYAETLARHRIAPPVPAHLRPRVLPDGSIDPAATHAALKEFMAALHVNSYDVERPPFADPLGADRAKAIRFLASTGRYLKENGWLRGAYAYWIDEPNDAKAYEEVRRFGALLHESGSGIPFLVTEQTKTQDAAWGDLYGAVDIWCPLWPLHDEATAAERLAKGERLWSYTALCQGDLPTPWWQIDFPPLNYRMPFWQSWRYKMEGILYWTMVYWNQSSDPWLDQPSFRGAYDGEGMLLYPGKDAGVEGPIETIRLKEIRDGFEDFEYLALLGKLAGRDAADAAARKLAPSWTEWERDPAKLLAAREEVAAKIVAAQSAKR